MTATAAAHAMAAISELERGNVLNPETAAWIHDGLVTAVSGRASSLDQALGFSARGQIRISSQTAVSARDEALRDAFEHCDGDCTAACLRQMVTAIRRFDATWRRVRHEVEPPARLTPLQRCLFAAWRSGARVPSSQSQLRRIVSSNTPF